MHSDQLNPKSYLKVIKKNIFSEGEHFPLTNFVDATSETFQNRLSNYISTFLSYRIYYICCGLYTTIRNAA